MIYFDVTKTAGARHRSGLMRVSQRLRDEWAKEVVPVIWRKGWRRLKGRIPLVLEPSDWLLTPELFNEAERPGMWEFIRAKSCRLAAIFHDAIPLKLPQITWPQSVERHPEYMKMLASFDRVLAVSESSRADLVGFWKWQRVTPRAVVETIALGANMLGTERTLAPREVRKGETPQFLCVGILEPRKNQAMLLDVAETLIRERLDFRLDVIGRVNPHFGSGLEQRLKQSAQEYPQIRYRKALGDREISELSRTARATLFPTQAEGCGLPLLESLWFGLPCLCSDLPVLRENGNGGGCEFVAVNDRAAWTMALRRLIGDSAHVANLAAAARARDLPTWSQTAATILQKLG